MPRKYSFYLPYLGMALPWQGWLDQGWRGSLLVVAVLLLRGLPAVLAVRPLLEALRAGAKDVHFLGWFGSIGSTALSLRETGIEEAWVVGSLLICASVLVHGVTATPLTELYGRLS